MSLYFTEHHANQPETLVLLHGGGLSSKQWQPQIPGLSDFHLLLPDLPEHGQTGGAFDLGDAARQVVQLIREHAHNGHAHIVGLSLGGAVVLELLRTDPACVKTALITGTANKLSRWLARIVIWNAEIARFLPRKTLVNLSIKQFGIEPYRDLVFDDLLHATEPAFNRHLAQALTAIELPLNNTVPLLVLVGTQETGVAKSAHRSLSTDIPNATSAAVPNVGHVWNLQQPALFCDVVRAWALNRSVDGRLAKI